MAGISVSIIAGKDKESSSVSVSGSIQHVISDQERTTFKLNDDQLKDAVQMSSGNRPNDAYLHSPTPWNDLYNTHGWPEVQTVLVPVSAEILEITSEPQVRITRTFANSRNTDEVTFHGSFNTSPSPNNTATSFWQTGGEFSVSEMLKHDVRFLGSGGGMSYNQPWGIGKTQSIQVNVNSSAGLDVTLKARTRIQAILNSSYGVMKVRIRYQAHLIGNTAINYNPTINKDHHFDSLGIGEVMASGGISNIIESTEDIVVEYLNDSDDTITVTDD